MASGKAAKALRVFGLLLLKKEAAWERFRPFCSLSAQKNEK